jgi:uncharacterized membrane protein YidH (DUF202 family)
MAAEGSVTVIVEIPRPSRASRQRRPRPACWPVFAIFLLIVGVAAAVLIVARW